MTASTADSTRVRVSLKQLAFAEEHAKDLEIVCMKRITDSRPRILRLMNPLRLARQRKLMTYVAIDRDPAVSGLYFL